MESEKSSSLDLLIKNPITMKLQEYYAKFTEKRKALGLTNPGSVENVAREVQGGVFLNNLNFSGLRADLTKSVSVAPIFQVSHALSMGSQGLPPYAYTALYGSPKVFMQASLDSQLNGTGRFNYRWSSALISKTNVQTTPEQAMISLEGDYTGADFTASIKAMNPSILDGGLTGIWTGSYLQAITPRLALGLEAAWQRPSVASGPDMLLTYAGRYKGDDWIASAQLLQQGLFIGSYWRRLTEKIEAGADINLQFAGASGAVGLMGGALRKEGTTTIGAKYDFRASSVRAQIDSQGRVACLLEKRVAPQVQVTFSGEIDHAKSQAKLGLAVSIESMDEEAFAQQEKANDMASPPF